jgi:YidC/Oxa1 family membrane protein insertase
MMKFYQENKINPLAGCLPLLVQMPIFLALFRVMREPYKHIPVSSDLFHAFCETRSKAQCGKNGFPHAQHFLSMDLSQHATAVSGGFLDALPYFVLVGLVIVTGFLQARQSRRNAPNMNAQMAMVTNILPIGFGLFSLQFPAGLVLYFLVSNLWRLGQQEIIMRKITRPGQAALAAAGVIDVEGSEKKPPAEPRAPGGLRKLFQLPPAADGNAGEATGTNGGRTPRADQPAGPTKPAPGKSGSGGAPRAGAGGSAKGSTGGASRSGSGSTPARRRSRKRKRR